MQKRQLVKLGMVAIEFSILLIASNASSHNDYEKNCTISTDVSAMPKLTAPTTKEAESTTLNISIKKETYVFSEREKYLLQKLAMAEAEGEDTEGKALVMRVVLNRVKSDMFPNDIESVIYEKKQFSPIANGRFQRVEPDADCLSALNMVIDGWDKSKGALYFESASDSTWHRENLKKLFVHGNHIFYKERER